MKKQLLLASLICVSSLGWSQALPFDFESSVTGMQGYDNATFTIVSNPSTTGNSSANVAKIVKVSASDQWAGGKVVGMASLNFSSAATSVLSMKVYTTEPVGTVIKIKLESPYTSEVDAVTTVSGAWETLLFDFGIPAPSGSTDLVIMPQPFTAGNGATFYVDDIEQIAGNIATPRAGLPITFEQGTLPDHFFSFESAVLTTLANPHADADNASAMVGKVVRYKGAPYGGSKITFANNLDFANHPIVTMKVWTSAPVGTYVTLKAEKPFWGEERSVQTTKSGQWETLSFDFSNAPLDMPTLALLFDFTAGSTNVGDGSANSTFFFDDLKFANVPLAVDEQEVASGLRVFPNPAERFWTVEHLPLNTKEVKIFNMQGQLVEYRTVGNETKLQIDAMQYEAGIYMLQLHTENGVVQSTLHRW